MVDTGIKVLSENEVEAKAIMERMKAQAGDHCKASRRGC